MPPRGILIQDLSRFITKTGPLSATSIHSFFKKYYCTVNRMASSITGPVRKPSPAEDEALAALESIPLFMKSLPEDDTQNSSLSALQSLIYEGTPDGGLDISPIHLL